MILTGHCNNRHTAGRTRPPLDVPHPITPPSPNRQDSHAARLTRHTNSPRLPSGTVVRHLVSTPSG
jgi:hypothetical protein